MHSATNTVGSSNPGNTYNNASTPKMTKGVSMIIRFTKEFVYLFAGMTALFACATGIIFATLAPFGLCIYLGDVLGFHDIIAIGATISVYFLYYVTARYFNLIEGI